MLSGPVIVGLFFAVLLMALLVGSIMLTAATLARSFRDASNLLTPVLFITLAPAILATLPTSSLTAGWAAVPIANGLLAMKALLTTGIRAGPFLIATVTTLMYTAGLLTLAARLYSDERALFSTEGRRARFSDIFVAPGDAKRRVLVDKPEVSSSAAAFSAEASLTSVCHIARAASRPCRRAFSANSTCNS